MVGFLAGAVLGFTLAAIVYLARPDRLQNRALALLLLLEALSSTAVAIHLAFDSVAVTWAGLFTFFLFWIGSVGVYPVFLGTLETPLARPLRHPVVLGAVWILCGTWAGLMFAVPEGFLEGPVIIGGAIEFAYGPLAHAFAAVSLPILLYALAVVLSAWSRAPLGSARRARAGVYAAAFFVRDALLLVSVANFLVLPWFVSRGMFGSVEALVLGRALYVAQIVTFPLLTGYGILRHQLFGIDLRVRLAVEKSTIAAVFAVVFLTASELVERSIGVEGVWFGVGAAVLIGLFFRRVERVGEAVADRIMPGVEDTEEYRDRRAREIYQAALESALVDGTVTDRERDVLATLADQLGLSAGDARGIERDVS